MNNSVYKLVKYGQVTIKLKELLKKKNITINKLATLTNSKFDTIKNYVNGEMQRADLDLIARICYVLDCKIEDIIEYKK